MTTLPTDSEFNRCFWIVALAIIVIFVLSLSGCATAPIGNETSAVRHNLTRIREADTSAMSDGKQILGNLQGAQRDAKEIRAILNFPLPTK